jgi:hypothetical protein
MQFYTSHKYSSKYDFTAIINENNITFMFVDCDDRDIY